MALNKLAFQIVTAHFINKTGHFLKATLALQEHKEFYNNKEQTKVLIKVLKEFDIKESQIGYIIDTLLSINLDLHLILATNR